MEITLRETIKSIVKSHLLSKKGKAYGQCLTAVGWVGGTLPELYENDGMVELSMADVSGGAIVTGAALSGSKPIYIVRYQGFQWYNCVSIINYAAKSKELWKRPCPLFIRSIAMENNIGPVAGSSHHSLYHRMPGLKIASPMSPNEYKSIYDHFLNDDMPYYVSEHRKSYDNAYDLKNVFNYEDPDFTIFAISITRFEMEKLYKLATENNIKINICHILWIKPLDVPLVAIESLKKSKFGGLVIDDDYVEGSQSIIANNLSCVTKKVVYTLGLEPKTAGFHDKVDIKPPCFNKIFSFIKSIINLNDS